MLAPGAYLLRHQAQNPADSRQATQPRGTRVAPRQSIGMTKSTSGWVEGSNLLRVFVLGQ